MFVILHLKIVKRLQEKDGQRIGLNLFRRA